MAFSFLGVWVIVEAMLAMESLVVNIRMPMNLIIELNVIGLQGNFGAAPTILPPIPALGIVVEILLRFSAKDWNG